MKTKIKVIEKNNGETFFIPLIIKFNKISAIILGIVFTVICFFCFLIAKDTHQYFSSAGITLFISIVYYKFHKPEETEIKRNKYIVDIIVSKDDLKEGVNFYYGWHDFKIKKYGDNFFYTWECVDTDKYLMYKSIDESYKSKENAKDDIDLFLIDHYSKIEKEKINEKEKFLMETKKTKYIKYP